MKEKNLSKWIRKNLLDTEFYLTINPEVENTQTYLLLQSVVMSDVRVGPWSSVSQHVPELDWQNAVNWVRLDLDLDWALLRYLLALTGKFLIGSFHIVRTNQSRDWAPWTMIGSGWPSLMCKCLSVHMNIYQQGRGIARRGARLKIFGESFVFFINSLCAQLLNLLRRGHCLPVISPNIV